jgi:hypothetical protein
MLGSTQSKIATRCPQSCHVITTDSLFLKGLTRRSVLSHVPFYSCSITWSSNGLHQIVLARPSLASYRSLNTTLERRARRSTDKAAVCLAWFQYL